MEGIRDPWVSKLKICQFWMGGGLFCETLMWVWVKMKRPRNGWSDATCDQEIICKYSFETKPIYEDVWPAQMWGYQVVVKQNIIEETWIQWFPVTWYCSKETRIWCSFKGILIGFQGYLFLGFQGGLMGFQGFILLERSLRFWPLVDQKGTQSLAFEEEFVRTTYS